MPEYNEPPRRVKDQRSGSFSCLLSIKKDALKLKFCYFAQKIPRKHRNKMEKLGVLMNLQKLFIIKWEKINRNVTI